MPSKKTYFNNPFYPVAFATRGIYEVNNFFEIFYKGDRGSGMMIHYNLSKENKAASLFFFPSNRSRMISAATRLKVMPLPPKPSAK
jgi:hypothetical protein